VQELDGTLVVSATDLVGFLECGHLITLEQLRVAGEIEKPIRDDPELDLIRRRGFDHEQAYLGRLRDEGRTVYEVRQRDARTLDELRAAQDETVAAMGRGEEVIFQATFFDGRWRGHADFLMRRDDRPSSLGPYSYDVADTKLARRVKAAAIVQMCVYADLLERLQGIPPETISVVTGDGVANPHRLADYAAYFRAAKQRFEERVFGTPADEQPATYPEPVDHCRVCSWWITCMDRRRADDHLSLVAGASRLQRKKLVGADVTTLEALGELPDGAAVRGLDPRILERLRRQAALQLAYRQTHEHRYELIPPLPDEPGKGLAALPAPSPLDVFWDIEADPWALTDGLEYLFGWTERQADGEIAYHADWAHDRAGEKAMLERFVDTVMDRLVRDPTMHVYHYGGYESGALKRLMQRHATREDEVDVLLRGRVLVNLYDHVVRQGIRASVESYSIKKLETFYMPEREGGITQAGFSVVEYERWMEAGDPAILDAIAAYNRDDCVSNLLLRDWLEERRIEAAPLFPGGIVPRPEPLDGSPPEELAAAQAETRSREDALRAPLPVDRLGRNDAQQAQWLLAGILDWHRREAKPQWWDHFRLAEASLEELVRDGSALGELTFLDDLGRVAKSSLHRYRFDPSQETRIGVGKSVIALAPNPNSAEWLQTSVQVIAIDPLAGTVDLKRNPAQPHPVALIPAKPYGTEPMRSALGRFADDVIVRGIEADDGRFRAARDLLLRRPPRLHGVTPGTPLAGDGEKPLQAGRRLGLLLDGTVLPIQGPPGTGKTHTGARMILDLVQTGQRVGVTAQSHRVIGNLLEEVARATTAEGVPLRIAQRTDDPDDVPDSRIERIGSVEAAIAGLRDGTWDIVGGTSWLWARDDAEASVDVLFVDEAGQLSLATVCSVSGAADSMVLLGDPNQLPQVSQGTHPEGAAASALEHLVGEARTIAPDRGLLLGTTYRLHPDVNAFISDAFYEGRLTTDPKNARQAVGDGELIGGTGVRFVPLVHEGAGNRSPDEAAWIAAAIRALVGRSWVDRDGNPRRLDVPDVLVVAPYNAQVAEIARTVERELGSRPNVGTVDKFQGREAPVAIYSMTTSTPDDAPRDPDFLYSGNRLNVALSRARGLAVLVASPALLRIAGRSPEEMRLVNAFCRFVEVAAEQAPPPPAAGDAGGARVERSLPSLESILVWTPRQAGARRVRPAADDPTLGL
jgi:predicted RecB family nuclease